jgi:hypothetical protein
VTAALIKKERVGLEALFDPFGLERAETGSREVLEVLFDPFG